MITLQSFVIYHSVIQLWSVKKNEEAAAKKKPKMSAAQLRVQKGTFSSDKSQYFRHSLSLHSTCNRSSGQVHRFFPCSYDQKRDFEKAIDDRPNGTGAS